MLTICQKSLQDTLSYHEVPVLTINIKYPCFVSTDNTGCVQTINNYYYQQAKNKENYCHNVLYQQAVENAEITKDQTVNPYEFIVDFTVTYQGNGIISLYLDTYTYTGGAHGSTVRTSQTWSVSAGTLLQLGDIYCLTPDSLMNLEIGIEQQISCRMQENPGIYFDDYRYLVNSFLNLNNFYLQSCCVMIYYQHYDIAPYSTGIPEFCFPLENFIPKHSASKSQACL